MSYPARVEGLRKYDKIDIICIQEHRYTHSEDIKYHDSSNGWTLAIASAWKNSVNATIERVGKHIGPQALKSLNSIEKIQPRMMVATFNGNPSATIISCYSPTNVSKEIELIAFYDELYPLVFNIQNTTSSSLAETGMPKFVKTETRNLASTNK